MGSHSHDFHNITQNGSKMCHGSVTGVMRDTTWCGTAVEPSRVAPQCLQGLILEKYCVFIASKGGGEKGASKFG